MKKLTYSRRQPDRSRTNRTGRPHALSLDDPLAGRRGICTRDLLTNLGTMMCTQREVASALGVTEKTLITFFKREPEAKELFLRGVMMGKVSLRRSQFELAKKNARMAIFLGKVILGQKDRRDLATPAPLSAADISAMSTEALVQLCIRIDAALAHPVAKRARPGS